MFSRLKITIKILILTLSLFAQYEKIAAFSSPLTQSHYRSNIITTTHGLKAVTTSFTKYHPTSYEGGFSHHRFSSRTHSRTPKTSLEMSLSFRGGALVGDLNNIATSISTNPNAFFNANLITLLLATVALKSFSRQIQKKKSNEVNTTPSKPKAIQSLQLRFLSVFWLLRCADWLQGPYFYEVYASKVFAGVPASFSLISRLFLTGFASTALFGPFMGRLSDTKGRKFGTLLFCFLYAIGAASTKSSLLAVLLFGRIMSGIGTSLLFSAPESWLVGEAMKKESGDVDGKYLGETFGLAYAGDSIVAILAGQFAGAAAAQRGPTGPFELSTAFLLAGGLLTTLLWKENKAESSSVTAADGQESKKASIMDAVKVVQNDPKIMLVGAVQSLFEAAMYIFVLQWPPAISSAVSNAFSGQSTPYGTVFSCLMGSCLLGSSIFGYLIQKGVKTETFTSVMLTLATLAMGLATYASSATNIVAMPLATLVAAFFAFEACVGMYFPSIGTLRSKYVPDSHRSVIMNLFGIPLNALVVSVFLSINRLGVSGALTVSTTALAVATASMFKLRSMVTNKK